MNYFLNTTDGFIGSQQMCVERLQLCDSPVIQPDTHEAFIDRQLGAIPEVIKNMTYVDDIYAKILASTKSGAVRPVLKVL